MKQHKGVHEFQSRNASVRSYDTNWEKCSKGREKTVLVLCLEERSFSHPVSTLVMLVFSISCSSFLDALTDISNFN